MDTAPPPDLLRYDGLGSQNLTRYGLERLLETDEFERIAPGSLLSMAKDFSKARPAIQQALEILR
ncbi:MAG: hypothetical protein ACTHZ5_01985 [Micrococcaceae bacterium]